ncbi:MAG TPA: hypothetical protein VGF17_04905 [Phytomonospora sp.]
MGFNAYEEVHGDPTLRLPIRGKEYVIWPPTAKVGKDLNMMLAAGVLIEAGVPLTDEDIAEARATQEVDDDRFPTFAQQCLNGPHDGQPGRVYEEMLEDDLTQPEVEIAVQTAFMAWTMGRDAAEVFWNTGGKALAQRQVHPALRQTETPTPPAEGTTTPRPASATGTRRKARAKAARAERSRGSSRTTTT